jgi:lysyl-tRNA synthetase, class II
MRRLADTPNGLMEFVLCETFVWAREHGIERVSLNFAAFGELLRAEGDLRKRDRVARFALSKADRYFQVERLLAFNRKFMPLWEPRYAAFESYSDVPVAALVSLSLESLLIWPRAVRRLWPEHAA